MKPSEFKVATETCTVFEKLKIIYQYAPQVASTNDLAKSEATKITVPLKIYLCDHQTHGRGRGGNQWQDVGAGGHLLATWSFGVDYTPAPILSPLVGLALYDSLRKNFAGCEFSLKAPNDILLGGIKLAGILIENVTIGGRTRVIIGIGLNVFASPRAGDFTSTHLSSVANVSAELWEKFVRDLGAGLAGALKDASSSVLSSDRCSQLMAALNLNSNLSEKVSVVSPEGSLQFPSRRVDWSEL